MFLKVDDRVGNSSLNLKVLYRKGIRYSTLRWCSTPISLGIDEKFIVTDFRDLIKYKKREQHLYLNSQVRQRSISIGLPLTKIIFTMMMRRNGLTNVYWVRSVRQTRSENVDISPLLLHNRNG